MKIRRSVIDALGEISNMEGVEDPDYLVIQDDIDRVVESCIDSEREKFIHPSEMIDLDDVCERMFDHEVFLGDGRMSTFKCRLLHELLESSLCILSCLQQGGCGKQGDCGPGGTCEGSIENNLRLLARALTGKEIEFVEGHDV